jgi:enterobactin synthetase component D / holo-[acyl-carrier protein] synthase
MQTHVNALGGRARDTATQPRIVSTDPRFRTSGLGSRDDRAPRASGARIEILLPGSACAETFSDVPELTMFPREAALVSGAVDERRREFATVRHCARGALRQFGLPAAAILPDGDGVPCWPAGTVGSMTHCKGYRAAAIGRSRHFHAIGIDAEPHGGLTSATRDLTLRDEERSQLPALAARRPDVHWDRVLFCAKEAVYKAWFPPTRRWLEFSDVSVTVQPCGTFEARILVPEPRVAGLELDCVRGRWTVGHGFIVAGASIRRRPVASRGCRVTERDGRVRGDHHEERT